MTQPPHSQPDDKTTNGDEVHGDKIAGHQIHVGDIAHSTAIAVGINVTQNVHLIDPNTASADLAFEQKYRQAVIHRLDRLELFGLPRLDALSRQQPLSVAYINLAFMLTPVDALKLGQEHRLAQLQRHLSEPVFANLRTLLQTVRNEAAHATERSSTSQRIADPEILAQLLLHVGLTRIVIQGKAGSGKSTLLQWLAIQHANSNTASTPSPPSLPVPFFLRLREFVNRGFPAPEEFPRVTVPQLVGNMPAGWVHRLLETGRAVLLIDGVDEMPQRERQPLLESLQALVATYPEVTYIITSRPAAVAADKWPEWTEWMSAEDFLPLVLDDMTPDQADHLIEHWHQALCHHQQHDEERTEILALATNLKRQLATRPELRRLTVSPLLCAMLCAVHHDRRQDLPRERTRLYQECVELLLNRRDQGRKIDLAADYPSLTESQKEEVIQSLAYWFLKNGYSTAEFAEVDAHIDSLLRLMQVAAATSEGVRRLLVERSSLLREPMTGWVDFPHRTFLEYLAAQAAVRASDFGVLLEHARDDQWRETIVLAMGAARRDECARFLQRLIKRADSYTRNTKARHQFYLLAAACLETPVVRDPAIENLIIDRVRQLLPPSSNEVIPALAKVGSSIIPLLAPDPDYSGQEAAYCIRVLSEIATDDALDQLTAYATDERWFVTDSLTDAWQNFDQVHYVNKVLKRMKRLTLYQPVTPALLAQLRHLEELTIPYEAPVDLKQLGVLTKLTSLHLFSATIQDTSSLQTLTSLKDLLVSKIQAADLPIIANLNSLEELSIHKSVLPDIMPLTGLNNLKTLQLYDTIVSDLSALVHFPALTTLHLEPANAALLLELDAPPSLRSLTIWTNPNSDIQAITVPRFPLLQSLCLSEVNVLDYSTFAHLPQLHELSLFNKVNFDLAAIPDPTQFTVLELFTSSDVSVAHIPAFINLRSLRVRSRMFDLHILHGLKHLRFLDIGYSDINSLEPLSVLQTLEELDLDAEAARDLRPLFSLPNLRRLRISGPGRIDRQTLHQLPHIVVERF